MKVTQRVGTWLRKAASFLSPISSGWYWPSIRESFTGAWQSNVTIDLQSVSANWAVFSCVTLIAQDIGKMPARVMQFNRSSRIWEPTELRPVLRRPNRYQTWPEFVKSWVFSLLLQGNTYVYLERNQQRFVVAMYVLNPYRVKPLVSPDGSVFYEIAADNLSSIQESIIVPSSELIHDRINTIWHPLCGVSPIYACGVAAMQGLAIQQNSAKFFQNLSKPGGILTAPGAISNETAARLKASMETGFSGDDIGSLLVLGDGVKYEAMTVSAEDSQLIEQLKFTGEMICATFHVPPYKLGLGQMPTTNNVAALNQQYFDQCLHPIVDGIERRLDLGLELDGQFQQAWFDTSELLRMDPSTRLESHSKAIGGGWLAPNEARRYEDLPPVEGGDVPFLQEQNWPITVLANRTLPEEATAALPAPEPDDEEVRSFVRERMAA